MAIIDWPSTRPFAGSQFSLDLDVSELAFRGPKTGNRTVLSHNADRMRAILSLTPCSRADAAIRHALIWQLRSNGDRARFGMQQHPTPTGTLRGSPVAAAAAAGARTISISSALAGTNLLFSSGFEIDTNADGLADGWTLYSAGAVSGVVDDGLVAGSSSPLAQRVYAAVAGSSTSDQFGIRYTADVPVTAGRQYSYAADTIGATSLAQVRLHIDWYNVSNVLLSSSGAAVPSTTGWSRSSVTATAPTGAVYARLYVWMEANTSGVAVSLQIDNVQFEVGSTATAYSGLPTLVGGDFIGIGGNLLMVGYAGCTGTDAGVLTDVPLALPLPAAVSSSAAVTWLKPTGLWELDADSVQLDYGMGQMQAGPVLPFRQVAA